MELKIDYRCIDKELRGVIKGLNERGFITKSCCQGRQTIAGCKALEESDKGHGPEGYIIFSPRVLPDSIIIKAEKIGLVVSEFSVELRFCKYTNSKVWQGTDMAPINGKWNSKKEPRISAWDYDRKDLRDLGFEYWVDQNKAFVGRIKQLFNIK